MSNQIADHDLRKSIDANPASIVLFADSCSAHSVQTLEAIGCHVDVDPSLHGESLAIAIAEKSPDILVVRSTKVTSDMMDASESLSIIIRAGAGYDTIDIQAASERGISVANCPGKNSVAVAELTWGLILSCDRRIPDQVVDLREGVWNKKMYSISSGLFGRTIGIVGLGGIGCEVIRRAHSFGMHVIAWSRSLAIDQAEFLGIERCESLLDIATRADVVSVHVSATSDTQKLIDAKFFKSMKDNAIFVNTSRGSVVDEAALCEAVESKHLRVGLDVYESEPSSGDNVFVSDIAKHLSVYGTHHIGASTNQAQEAVASEVIKIIDVFTRESKVLNCVNLAIGVSVEAMLSIRHKNLPGVLSHIFDELSIASINVEEMENVMYEGSRAACARIQLSTIPSQELLNNIKNNENVFSVTLTTKFN